MDEEVGILEYKGIVLEYKAAIIKEEYFFLLIWVLHLALALVMLKCGAR